MSQSEDILFEADTDLDHYQVIDRVYEGRSARVLFSGSERYAQSGVALDENPDLLFDYNQRLLELSNALYPAHILVIGGGACTLPMALMAALPDATVDVVELDAELPSIAKRFFGLRPSERLQVIIDDGRNYLQHTKQQYDLIILDVFQGLSVPRQFLTAEFIALARSRLSKTGTIALNIIASYRGRDAGLIKSQIAGYKATFTTVSVFPAARGLTSWLPQNLVLVAQKHPLDDLATYMRYKPFDLPGTEDSDIISDT